MDRAFASGASGVAPTVPAIPSIGYPTAGNPGSGTPATKPGPWWYHMVTEELRGIIAASGITPSESDITQLLQALPGALASRPEMGRSLAASGYQKLPGGLIIQWGSVNSTYAGATVTFPIAFPNAVFSIATAVSGTTTTNPENMNPYNLGLTSCQFYSYDPYTNTGLNALGWFIVIGR